MSRQWHSLFLLIVIVGQLFIGVHAEAHPPAGQAGCEICSAYGNPIDALPASDPSLPALAWAEILVLCSAPAPVADHTHPAFPRAPPDNA